MAAGTPRQRIEATWRAGRGEGLLTACLDLLAGREADRGMLRILAGSGDLEFTERPVNRYWLRVWALRGLLWAWDDRALPALLDALADEHWRPREMAAKVAARHLQGDALPALVELAARDPVRRVRAAASRAVALLTAASA